jgi:hypothetical protein
MSPASAICVSPQQPTLQACWEEARQSLGSTADSLRADFLSLDERLADAEPCSDRPLAIASIPYGYMHITIALHSARLGAECYLAGKTRSKLQARLASDLLVRFDWRP